jgi:putative drug exporter of the RND superfamily
VSRTEAPPAEPGRAEEPRPGRGAGRYAAVVVKLRHVIVAGWLLGVVAVVSWLPGVPGGGTGGDLEGFVPADSAAVRTETESLREFGFPLLARTVIVQRDPQGLDPFVQAESVLRALALTQGSYEDQEPILGALPLVNTLGLFPGAAERGTTALTYVFMPPFAGFAGQAAAAREFAERYIAGPEDALVGVTGSVPARATQARLVSDALPLVEAATLAAIVAIVGFTFRSVVAPLLALVTAGIAYVATLRVAGMLGRVFDIGIPQEMAPLIVALLLGVATDYVIFFLSGLQHELRRGRPRLAAARGAAAEFGPIVGIAGLTVAAGTAALVVADSVLFRAFGPGMAITVLVAVVVSLTLVPAMLALAGRWLFWPSRPRPHAAADPAEDDRAPGLLDAPPRPATSRTMAVMTFRPVAALVVVACTAGLVLAAMPLRDLRLGVSFVPSLPEATEERTAAEAATAGFAQGILSPSVLLLQEQGITSRRPVLTELGRLLQAEPGVAGVLGPGDLRLPSELGILLATSGDAARYLVVLDDEPLGASAIATIERLQERLPVLLAQVGLSGVRAGFAGDSALAAEIVAATTADLGRIAVTALLVNLLLLVLFLRALVAPLYLLATSVLALCASLGAATYVFQDLLGHDGLTFYVPFAAAVLLVALGSDYNIFGVGHIWAKARTRPLRAAVTEAVPQTTRAITAAGITLAASFGMLALVPLQPFRELAFVMAVGILLDAVVVRSLLVPTLLVLVGRASGWPGRSLSGPPVGVADREPVR